MAEKVVDRFGLQLLLQGREVVALTETTASIRMDNVV
jgi:hypothetical protein